MKKIMLGVLVLIPILIMLIVGLVTSFVSTQAYIGVESVSIEVLRGPLRRERQKDHRF